MNNLYSKEDVIVRLFKKGKKKPIQIPNKSFNHNSYYEVFTDHKGFEYEFIDKIEVEVKEKSNDNVNILVLRLQDYVEDKPVDTIVNQMVEIKSTKRGEVFIGSSIGGLSDLYKIIIRNGERILQEFSYWIR
jgi:3-oxoacyl-(acyl-carrier-protein) synthase